MKYRSALNRLIFFILVITGFFSISPFRVSAAYFDEAVVRFDRLQPAAPLSGRVCARPSAISAGIEAKVSLTFPADFTIASDPSDWTISGTDLPAGAVFWPQADSQPVSVSGQTLSVTTADLTAMSLYCFNFSSVSSVIGPTGAKSGRIATYTSANAEIDAREFAVRILGDDQISLTGRVAAKPTDMVNSLGLVTVGSPYFSQETVLEYRLAYGTTLDYSTDLTVRVSWSLGTVQGEMVPTVVLLEYPDQGAGTAFGSTPAVVDPNARTITWNIQDFPANTQEEVSFRLRTRSNHPGNLPVDFSVSSQVGDNDAVSISSTVASQFRFDNRPVPAAPGTSVASPTPVPVGVSSPPVFSGITIREISAEDALLSVTLDQPARVTVYYGRTLESLASRVTSPQFSRVHSLGFPDLLPDTQYFFRLLGQPESGRSVSSGIYTFRTASSTPQKLSFDPKTFFALSSGQLIFDPSFLSGSSGFPYLVIPKNIDYEIKFSLTDPSPVDTARVLVENKQVLGWSSTAKAAEPNIKTGEVLEIASNAFTTRLVTPGVAGDYEIFVVVTDVYGNQTTTKLADLFVTDYLTVTDTSGRGIESAQINFYLYDASTRTYRFISPQIFALKNPDYTDRDGRLRVALPPLTYRIEVNAIGYKPQTVNFSLQPGSHNFPALKLENEPFVLKTWVGYYAAIVADTYDLTRQYVESLTGSSRFFRLSALLTICIFIFLSFLSLRTRTNIPMLSLFEHFWRHAGVSRAMDSKHERIFGRVVDKDSGKLISHAGIFVLDDRGKVVSHVYSDQNGEFALYKLFPGQFRLEVLKEGFASAVFDPAEPLVLSLTHVGAVPTVFARVKSFFWSATSLLLEVFLIASLGIEIFFALFFSWWQVLPFFLMSLSNLVLWLVYRIHLRV